MIDAISDGIAFADSHGCISMICRLFAGHTRETFKVRYYLVPKGARKLVRSFSRAET